MCAWCFPGSSAGKESSCNARNSCLIPGLGRSPGEGIGHPLQYSWASLVAQIVKNPPAMQETWVRSLGREDPLEESMATHSSILTWRIPLDRGTWWAIVHGSQRVRHDWATKHNIAQMCAQLQKLFFAALLWGKKGLDIPSSHSHLSSNG